MGETGALILAELSFRRQTGVGRRGEWSLGVLCTKFGHERKKGVVTGRI